MSRPEEQPPIILTTLPRVNNYAHEIVGIIYSYGQNSSPSTALGGALADMRTQAREAGADAIIGIHHTITSTTSANGYVRITVSAIGTAVRLPWPVGRATPELLAENPDNLPVQ